MLSAIAMNLDQRTIARPANRPRAVTAELEHPVIAHRNVDRHKDYDE